MRNARTLFAAAACAIVSSGLDAGQLYRAALVDSFDFARHFDIETKKGSEQIVDHVLSRGGNAVWWRANGGAIQRYPGGIEVGPSLYKPFNKVCPADEREYYGWLRLDRGETNLIAHILGHCRARGIPSGIHVAYEENHHSIRSIGGWNSRHPQYWVRTRQGASWPGRASMAFPEVFERKVRMMGELLDMEPEWFFIDMWRSNWTLAYEYVEPMLKAWRGKYGCEPPEDPEDPRWIALFEPIQTAFFHAIRREIVKRGSKTKLCIGIPYVTPVEDENYKRLALDWRKLAADGTADALAVMCVRLPKDAKGEAVWEATRAAYRHVYENRGKAEVFYHCSMYDGGQVCIPAYRKRTGLSNGECAKRFLDLAEEFGGKGVVLECVDYGNYPDDVVKELNKR